MVLKDYESWADECYNYWYNIIINDTNLTDTDKTTLLDTLLNDINTFKTECINYKSRFPSDKYKRMILAYYTYYSNGVLRYSNEVPPPDVKGSTNYIFWYTYALPSTYDSLFSIVQDQTTLTYYLDDTNFLALVDEIKLLDDSITFESIISTMVSYSVDISLFMLLSKKKMIFNKQAPTFEEFTEYPIVCKEFNVIIPGLNL